MNFACSLSPRIPVDAHVLKQWKSHGFVSPIPMEIWWRPGKGSTTWPPASRMCAMMAWTGTWPMEMGMNGMNFMGLQTWEAGHVFRKWELADIKWYSCWYYIVICIYICIYIYMYLYIYIYCIYLYNSVYINCWWDGCIPGFPSMLLAFSWKLGFHGSKPPERSGEHHSGAPFCGSNFETVEVECSFSHFDH